ncbi:MAG TPA: hypothetical protein DEF43_03255 [Chloroflexus aurantiacus]|jgi:hypothetical protein|nr:MULTISPECIES: hypothetical protein [Chloroflexus]RMG53718.1 MAG: hypothetical protein D6716_00135 [Chloroflexota bacterium]GIV93616.1 MAG: hypothetical protein KatS3mg056_2325 [Chloroflexus sp.]HBW66180.1 hypothetical protein [Chloroflexus aurantiacus]
MGTIRVTTFRRDVARRWELAATHIVRAVTPSSVACNVVLFTLAASLRSLLTVTWVVITNG